MTQKRRCSDILREKHPNLDPEEMQQLVDKMQGIEKQFADDPVGLQKAKSRLLDEVELAGLQYVYDKHMDAVKHKANMAHIKQEAFKNAPDEGALSVVEDSNIPGNGNKASMYRVQRSYNEKHLSNFIDDFNEAGLRDFLISKQDEKEIYKRLKSMDKPNSAPHADPRVEQSAQLYKKHGDALFHLMKAAGIDVRYLSDWAVRQAWNASEMLNRKKEWVADHMKEGVLDLKRMFPEETNKKVIEKKIGEMYDTLVNTGMGVPTGSEKPRNILKNLESARTIHFASDDAAWDSMQKWGFGGLMENFFNNIDRTTRSVALVERLGRDYVKNFERLISALDKEYKGSPKVRQGLDRARESFRMFAFGINDGYTTPAKVVKGAKEYISIVSLGQSFLTGTTGDISATAVNLRGAGGQNILGATADAVITFFEAWGTDSKEVAKEFHLAVDLEVAEYTGRFTGEDSQGRFTRASWSRLKTNAYRMMLLPWQFITSRKTNAILWGRKVGKHVGESFDQLHPNLRAAFLENNITEDKWNIIRKADKRGMGITVLGVDKLPLSEFKNNFGVSEEAFKHEVLRDYTGFIHTRVDAGTPIPDLKTHRRLARGLDPDSSVGLIMSLVRQFKSVPFKVGADIAGHIRRETGQASLKDAFNPKLSLNGYKMAAEAGLHMTVMAYAGMVAKAYINDKDHPDPENLSTWTEAFARGGAAGMWGDLLLGEFEKSYMSALGTAAGPGLSRVNEALEIIAKMRAGKKVTKQQANFIWRSLPMNNYLFLPAALKKNIIESIEEGLQ